MFIHVHTHTHLKLILFNTDNVSDNNMKLVINFANINECRYKGTFLKAHAIFIIFICTSTNYNHMLPNLLPFQLM